MQTKPIADPLPSRMTDPERLAASPRPDDPAWFEELVRLHGPRMLAVTRRITGSEHDAEEALQEAFVCAFRKLEGFQGHAQISTWLYRIAINAALMHVRSRDRRRTGSIEDLLPSFTTDGQHAEGQASCAQAPADPFEREEALEHVRAAIDRLPAPYRTVLVLRDIEELSTAETALRLGASQAAVKVRLHRARQALRTLIQAGLRAPVEEALPV